MNNSNNQSRNTGGKSLPNVNIKAIMRYSMLPGIVPRIRALSFHFGHLAYLIAIVLNSARLIPNNHQVLHGSSFGKFGVRQVLAIAANNITWSRNNIDQIAIFAAVLIGLILILIQAVLIALAAFTGTAFANPSAADSFFETPSANVQTDVALIFLEQVFGPNLNIFGAAAQPIGTPVFTGLQAMLGLYSFATLVIAVIIVVYYILTVVAEAAQTGTPFGRRFNSVWAPIRLIVALGLLIPLGNNINSAQYITLYMAKFGSGLGTQVWSIFTENITSASSVVSRPADASTTGLVSRIFLNEVCAASYNQIEQGNNREITLLQALGNTSQAVGSANAMVQAAINAGQEAIDISWSNRTAGQNATDYTCGHITVSLADFDLYRDGSLVDQEDRSGTGFWNWVFGGVDLADRIGTVHSDIRAAYIDEISSIANAVRPAAQAIAEFKISVNATGALGDRGALDGAGIPGILQQAATTAHQNINLEIQTTFNSLTNSEFAGSDAFEEMIRRGWGAAGLWYGNIAKINQKYLEAVNAAVPTLGTIVGTEEIPNPGFFSQLFGATRYGLTGGGASDLEAALTLANSEYAGSIASGVPPSSPLYADARLESAHENAKGLFSQAIIWILGGSQVYDLKNNPQLDPMARLAGSGHAIITRSLGAFGVGAAAGAGGSLLSGVGKTPFTKFVGEAASALSSLLFALATIALVAGVFLAYIIPLMPFIYFAFAVIGWVLEIFEAIIAMPLWALAHLRIDGDGLPGAAAINGYHLLLAILIRPALIIFGLVGGYVIFGAAMFYLTTLYNSATSITQQDIAGGSNGAVAIFVYTLVFAFLAYNIATAAFKLIDDVPRGILRWLGSGAQTFGDSRGDPIQGSREAVVGAVAGASTLSGGLQNTGAGLQRANLRRQQRNQGIDPDNPIQQVQIVGGPSGPGGSIPPTGPTGPGGGPIPTPSSPSGATGGGASTPTSSGGAGGSSSSGPFKSGPPDDGDKT